jgi:hypothetical protein
LCNPFSGLPVIFDPHAATGRSTFALSNSNFEEEIRCGGEISQSWLRPLR